MHTPAHERPNVVWISLESVRADHTSLGGYHRDTTPNLRRIVEAGGVHLPHAFATARWTPAVSASVLTGTYLSTHRVGWADTRDVQRVPDGLRTLPERLSERGYRTALFSSNPYVSPATGLDRGFDRVHRPPTKADLRSAAGARTALRYARTFTREGAGLSRDLRRHKDCVFPLYQVETLKTWLREFERDGDVPYFLYTHMNSSHHPYNPPLTLLDEFLAGSELSPAEAIERAKAITSDIWGVVADGCVLSPLDREALFAVYDAEIALADRYVGELFDLAVASDRPTVVVVAGDHGELFGEQGMLGHNLTLHDGLVHVPLVVYGVDGVEAAAGDLVQPIDVTRTLLAALDAGVDGCQGVDLRDGGREYALLQRGPRRRDVESIRERNPDFDRPYHLEGIDAVRSREWKYCRSADRVALYRLPDEETDVAAAHPDVVAELDAAVDAVIPDERFDDGTESAAFSAGMRRQLADLGYL
jgi:arylsulfatase A-like enzyme